MGCKCYLQVSTTDKSILNSVVKKCCGDAVIFRIVAPRVYVSVKSKRHERTKNHSTDPDEYNVELRLGSNGHAVQILLLK